MPKEREFVDPELERIIYLKKQENSTDPEIHIPYNDLTVKKEKKINSFRFKDGSEMTESEVNILNETIEELYLTPFILLVTTDFSLNGNCKNFDDFISRLRYCHLYINYRQRLARDNPKVVKVKKFLFMTKKTEKRERPTKKVFIKYQNSNKTVKKKEYSDHTSDYTNTAATATNFYDPHLYFGGLACVVDDSGTCNDYNESNAGCESSCNYDGGACDFSSGNDTGGGCDSGGGFDSGGGCDSGGGGSCCD